jgi:hypothetical protein
MDERVCKQCGSVGSFKEVVGPFGPHYGKNICRSCDGFHSFLPKPKNETKRPNNKYTAESLGFSSCQMCNRTISRLGLYESLEVHHVEEIQHGGLDVPENIWCVCTPCHQYIHHVRVYLNDHQKHKITKKDLIALMDRDNVPENVRGYMFTMLEGSQR